MFLTAGSSEVAVSRLLSKKGTTGKPILYMYVLFDKTNKTKPL